MELSQEMLDDIETSAQGSNTYSKLANSIAPEIFG
jgi:DNA replicative helicase MCM subunit Mcm2 (Cdc46/Mcm family)